MARIEKETKSMQKYFKIKFWGKFALDLDDFDCD